MKSTEKRIRPITSDEYEDLIRLWSICGLKYHPKGRDSFGNMKKEFERMETVFLGMYDDDRMIGAVIGTSDGRKGWINRLVVDPDYRGRGLALKLIAECEEALHDMGLKVISCLIEDWNTPSLSCFEKAGYVLHGDIVYCSKRESDED